MRDQRHLRVLMLGHKRIPSREGGVEIVVEELCARMAALGHRITCYNRSGSHVSGRQFDSGRLRSYRNIRIKTVPALPMRGLAAMSASIFGAIGAAFGRYDVIHFHAEGSALLCALPRLLGKRVVVTVHGLDWQRAKWGRLARTYIRLGERAAARFAHEIIVLSSGVQQYFRDTYGRETRLIPNGVTPAIHAPADEITRRFGLEKDGYILFLGRIVPEKGIKNLIEAFKGVRTDRKLVIAGGASDTDAFFAEMQALAAEDARILFTGFVQGTLLSELYSNAYIYTLPSDLEGMPLSLLEAMSHSNCCLTSDIGECTQITGDRGVTFRRGDRADLRNRLQQLCDEPSLVEKCRTGSAESVLSRYSWDEITRQTLSLYRK